MSADSHALSRSESADRVGRYQISHRTGVVRDVQARSQQRTSTYGGGGMLHNGSGYIAAPTTSTISQSWQRVFVADDSSGEWHFEVGDGFPVRGGNRIKATYVGKASGLPVLAAVRNLDSGEGWRWPMKEILPSYSSAVLLWALIVGVWGFLLVAGKPPAATSAILSDFLFGGPILPSVGVVLVFRWFQRLATQRRLWKAIGHA